MQPKKKPFLDDIFSERIDLPGGGHADVLRKREKPVDRPQTPPDASQDESAPSLDKDGDHA